MLLSLIAVCAAALAPAALATGGKATHGVVYAGVTHQEGDDLYISGDFKDSVLGRGAIVYITRVSGGAEPGTVHASARKITIYTTKGSLTGKGEADQTFNSDGTSTIANGQFALKRGTGAYEGDTFTGTFDGSYSDGVYTFNYKGKLK